MKCDPEFFYNFYYPIGPLHFTIINTEVLKYFVTFMKVFNLFHVPFLILLPFCMNRLRTSCRKIISMIVLSDSLITSSVINLEKFGIHFHEDSYKTPCFTVNLLLDAVLLWSQLWSVFKTKTDFDKFFKSSTEAGGALQKYAVRIFQDFEYQ